VPDRGRALPVAIVPVIALILPAPAHGDSRAGPGALLGVGVRSWLVIKDVREKTVTTGRGGTEGILDYVIAEHRAYIRAKEPGRSVTLHVLLPEGSEVLESRFYPSITGANVPNARWERVKPVCRSGVTWELPGRGAGVGPVGLRGDP